MIKLRNGVAIAGAVGLLVALMGCATAGVQVMSAHTPLPSPTQTQTPTPVPTAAAPVAQPVAAAPPASPPISACVGTPAGVKHIYVSISDQHLWACTGDVLLTDGPVTTGASALTNVHDATPIGNWRITGKSQKTVLAGSDVNGSWNDPVTYWMPFSGGVGFHDSPWQTFPLGSPLYTTQGSHGCVHVPLDVLTTVFNWASVGTPVTVRG